MDADPQRALVIEAAAADGESIAQTPCSGASPAAGQESGQRLKSPLPEYHGPREKCALFGIHAPERDVSRITYYGLLAQQHRGQESSGIAVANGEHITCHKDMGLVTQVFHEDTLQLLKGTAAIGHNRYSTTGGSVKYNAQPLVFNKHFMNRRAFALGHNGNLVNTVELRDKLLTEFGVLPNATSDTVLVGQLLEEYVARMPFEEALPLVGGMLRGAFCIVVLTSHGVWAMRDSYGVRPLCLGVINKGYVAASESCAFPLIGAKYLREVEPGEVVRLDETGITSWRLAQPPTPKHCMFEYFYFARPDSLLGGSEVYSMRFRMGEQLWREAPVEADIVIGVPESGRPAAEGCSAASGLPVREGLVKNRYVHRTFIAPIQSMRDSAVQMKYSPLREAIAGKRIVLIDDSIVRGSTTRKIPDMLRQAGAAQIHMRISSPPIKHPCFYGIDFGDPDELIANKLNVEQIRQRLGVDSLHYLSIDGMVAATGFPRESFCLACFNNHYPIPLPGAEQLGKHVLEIGHVPAALPPVGV